MFKKFEISAEEMGLSTQWQMSVLYFQRVLCSFLIFSGVLLPALYALYLPVLTEQINAKYFTMLNGS